jgi:phosphosulfolactate phosphohydrolase-like enzyme
MEVRAMKKVVRIDALPESAWRYAGYDAIVCIDVLLSSTTIVSALAQGRRVFAAPTAVHALWFQSRVPDAVVLTDDAERADEVRYGGPAQLAAAEGQARDLIHVSAFAEMLAAAVPRALVYAACLRNIEATANELAGHHTRVAILGAGERGEVSTEDQMVAAWLAARLQQRGFELEGHNTVNEVERWGVPDVSLIGWSRAAERLRARGRAEDVEFVLKHFDDLEVVGAYVGGEVRNPALARQRAREEEDDRPTPAWGTPLPVPGH